MLSVDFGSIKVGDTVYRVFNPGDGGEHSPQYCKVCEVYPDYLICEGGIIKNIKLSVDDFGKSWFTSRGECNMLACKLNGYTDTFDMWCKAHKVLDCDRGKERLKLMEEFGATDYNDLCLML